jgi:hypothetical protein
MLFELIGIRYERRSLLITASPGFGKWGRVFPDKAMTLAAIDRLVHDAATMLEMNVESYRARKARERKRSAGKSPVSDKQDGDYRPRQSRRDISDNPECPGELNESTGSSLSLPGAKGEIRVADHASLQRDRMAAVLDAGADLVVRAGWKNARWLHADGDPVELLGALRKAAKSGLIDRPIWIGRQSAAPLALRLVAAKKPLGNAGGKRADLSHLAECRVQVRQKIPILPIERAHGCLLALFEGDENEPPVTVSGCLESRLTSSKGM